MEKNIKELENKIREHKALYYQGRPELLDEEYDQLEEELKKCNPESDVLNLVGSKTLASSKIKHAKKMLSLDKTFKESELDKWIGDESVISMYKIDGTSCSLIYREGRYYRAKTRGDGVFGEDITKNIEWIASIPKNLEIKNCEIRGEIYCNKDNFQRLIKEMKKINLDAPRSQRNIVSGLIGRKENIELCRYLDFFAFDFISSEKKFQTEKEKIDFIKNNFKFPVPKTILHKKRKKINDVIKDAEIFITKGNYLIDGLVFSYNDLSLQENLGSTAHHPRYRMAFKFKGKVKRAKIVDIIWSVSRNGYLVPVAKTEPIELSGAMVSRVSLHNFSHIKEYKLKKGDEISVVRSGEVIPKFLEVIKKSSGRVRIPKKCPSCGREVKEESVHLVCSNKNCLERNREEILNFIHKIGIQGFSTKRLEMVMAANFVKKIPDLYRLKRENLISLERTKEKLADGIIAEILESKKCDLVTFLSALGIAGGAYNKCEKIVQFGFNSIEKIKNLSLEELCKVESFAEKSAREFLKSLTSKEKIINELLNFGFDFKGEKNLNADNLALFKKNIVLTGKLSRNRSDIEKEIKRNGGIISQSVSKRTDYLVTNDMHSNSSKAKRARELGISMISEEDFLNLW